jgi:hypothetical protein
MMAPWDLVNLMVYMAVLSGLLGPEVDSDTLL